MPIYEYVCDGCRNAFEQLVRDGSRKDSAVCPACGSREVKRKLSVFGVGVGQQASGGEAIPGQRCLNCPESDGMCPYQ